MFLTYLSIKWLLLLNVLKLPLTYLLITSYPYIYNLPIFLYKVTVRENNSHYCSFFHYIFTEWLSSFKLIVLKLGSYFILFILYIFRERVQAEQGRERNRENVKQAPHPAWSWCRTHMTLSSGPELKSMSDA